MVNGALGGQDVRMENVGQIAGSITHLEFQSQPSRLPRSSQPSTAYTRTHTRQLISKDSDRPTGQQVSILLLLLKNQEIAEIFGIQLEKKVQISNTTLTVCPPPTERGGLTFELLTVYFCYLLPRLTV